MLWDVWDQTGRHERIRHIFEGGAAQRFARKHYGESADVRQLCSAIRASGGPARLYDAVVDGKTIHDPIWVGIL